MGGVNGCVRSYLLCTGNNPLPFYHKFSTWPTCAHGVLTLGKLYAILIPYYTLQLSHNHPLFHTRGSLTFGISIASYTITHFIYLFYLFYSAGTTAAGYKTGVYISKGSHLGVVRPDGDIGNIQ